MKRGIWMGLMASLAACGPHVQETRYTRQVYGPTGRIDVLDDWPAGRRFVPIGEATSEFSPEGLEALLARGRSMGADAVLLGPEERRTYLVWLGTTGSGGRLAPDTYYWSVARSRVIYLKYLPPSPETPPPGGPSFPP